LEARGWPRGFNMTRSQLAYSGDKLHYRKIALISNCVIFVLFGLSVLFVHSEVVAILAIPGAVFVILLGAVCDSAQPKMTSCVTMFAGLMMIGAVLTSATANSIIAQNNMNPLGVKIVCMVFNPFTVACWCALFIQAEICTRWHRSGC
jgi:hypothetical protein